MLRQYFLPGLFFLFTDSLIWVIGDSIIGQAGFRNHQLVAGGSTWWDGIGGTRFFGILAKLKYLAQRKKAPTTLIIHIGACEIFRDETWRIRDRIEQTLLGIRALLKNTRIIWSDILPRLWYEEEYEEGCGKKTTINLNKWAHKVLKDKVGPNTYHICHYTSFNPKNTHLFNKKDGLHLSEVGRVVLRQDFSDALAFFKSHPWVRCYPPHE